MEQSDLSNQRQRLLDLVLQVGLASVGTGLASGVLKLPGWLSVLLIVVGGLLTLTSSILVYYEQRRQDRAQEAAEKRKAEEDLQQARAQKAKRQRALEEAVQYKPCPVRLTDPYEARLAFRSERAKRYQLDQPRPPYVGRRCTDEKLRYVLMNPRTRIILVEGCARVGKGRTTFEAALQALPDRWVVIPSSLEGLKTLRSLWPPCPEDTPVLLWLDELQELIRPAGLSRTWLGRWLDDAREIKIIGLLRMEEDDRIDQPGEINRPLQNTLRWLRDLPVITVSRDHTPDEQAEIKKLYPGEEVKGSLGDYLVTVDEHLKCFEKSKEVRPEGFLVVWACAVAQYTVRRRWIGEGLLKAIYRVGVKRFPSTRRLTMSEFPSGLEYATAEFGDKIVPLVQSLQLGTTALYQTPRYIVEYVVEHLLPQEDPVEGQIGDIWGAILGQVDASDALEMGRTAYNQGRLDRAQAAGDKALASGDLEVKADAGIFLAIAAKEQAGQAGLEDADRRRLLGQALDFLEQARQTDLDCEPRANRLLGEVLTDLGRYREAEAAYQRAIDSMHPDECPRAMWRMGTLLHEHLNDVGNARHFLERAMASGHYDVTPRADFDFAKLVLAAGKAVTPEDHRLAIYALERASRSEHEVAPQAGFKLGEHHRQRDDDAQAIVAYERVVQLQDPSTTPRALLYLGEIRVKHNEFEAAQASLQQLTQWPSALSPDEDRWVGSTLIRCGDPDGARNVFQRVMETDDHDAAARAALDLGTLESEQGNLPAARRALEVAVPLAGQAGDETLSASAKVQLGEFLLGQQDPSAAEVFLSAIRDMKGSSQPDHDWFVRAETGYITSLEQTLKACDPQAAPEAAADLTSHYTQKGDPTALDGLMSNIDRLPEPDVAHQARLQVASTLIEEGHIRQGMAVYDKTATSTPRSAAEAWGAAMDTLEAAAERATAAGDHTRGAVARVEQGDVLHRQGDPKGAASKYKAAMQEMKGSGRLDHDLAVRAETGYITSSEQILKTCDQQAAPEAAGNLARHYAQKANLTAIDGLMGKIDGLPEPDVAHQARLRVGSTLTVISEGAEADGNHRTSAVAKVALGDFFRCQGDPTSAVVMYKRSYEAITVKGPWEWLLKRPPSMEPKDRELLRGADTGIVGALRQTLDVSGPHAVAEVMSPLAQWRPCATRDAALERVLTTIGEWPNQNLADRARWGVATALEKPTMWIT